ncbi:putative short chain dehydrogenase [Rosellinia necatrix]|uniref:Putative short chain dehydrogenase n=1 Tax=Rosellinia necatrix TaxID=77044 RepID=A0A1W2TH82_ROSNE|nr:putative short chain dehydrogenase [Rosellinia necatrix]
MTIGGQSPDPGNRHGTAPAPPEPRENPAVGLGPGRDEVVGQKRLADFDLAGRVFIVTGGARGLGLSLAEALVETGGKGTSLIFSTDPRYAATTGNT